MGESGLSPNGLFARVFGAGAGLSEPNGLVIKSEKYGAGALFADLGTGESDMNLTCLVALLRKSD